LILAREHAPSFIDPSLTAVTAVCEAA